MSLRSLLSKSVRNPRRALLRLVLRARKARLNEEAEHAQFLRTVSELWSVDAGALALEYRQSEHARWYRKRLVELRAWRGPTRMGTTGFSSCEELYLLVRAARPRVVVETGVLYGASTGHILAALEANGAGRLHSIDLGLPPGEPPPDFLVHPQLRSRWEYIEGDSRRELPPLLARLDVIDLFYHDSLHTFDHMTWEFEVATSHLGPAGILSSHDVLTADSIRGIFRENAFPAFCRSRGLRCILAGNSGFAVRPGFGATREGDAGTMAASASRDSPVAPPPQT